MAEKKIPWWLRRKDDRKTPTPPEADYAVVSTVSNTLVGLLREQLVPKLLQSEDHIGLVCPSDHAEARLGLYLYDILENGESRINGFQPVDQQYLKYPPMYLDLCYMVTTYLDMDVRYRFEEEHRLLGGAMQVFYDNPVVEVFQGGGNEELRLELNNLDIGDKMKIWSGLGENYRLSLFYKVTPVRLESTLFKKVTRVKEFTADFREKESL